MNVHHRLQELLATSREVIRDCALENGAVVAANTDKPYTPREAANYRAVWPRDAAFVCVAAKRLGMREIGERFLRWLDERPEGFRKERLLYQKYAPNGRKDGGQFQVDQMGTLLWFIDDFIGGQPDRGEQWHGLIERLADGIVHIWNGTIFERHVTDLWEQEERHTTHTMRNNFTYSLAACARGLLLAHRFIPNSLWQDAASQMVAKVNEAFVPSLGYFVRNHGRIDDKNADASLLGLAWPFALVEPHDDRMEKTLRVLEERLVEDGGMHRFQFDYYDGEGSAQEGGGAWPLLNFWMAIVLHRTGNREKAERYFRWVLDHVQNEKYHGYLPEQVFADDRIGIYPLAWSHAMFVLACDELGYLS